MKKSLLFVAAMFAAVAVNAKVINVDLSKATEMAYINCSATPSYADDVLTVDYNTAGGWEWAGVEIALDNLDVTSVDFEYKGVTEGWTSFVVYLRAEDGARWYDNADDFSMSHADWFSKAEYVPTGLLWDASDYAFGEKPFIALGFIANPGSATTGTFSLRKVKLTVPGDDSGTAVENVSDQHKVTKVVRGGQVLFLRDGKTFNALGAEVR